MTVVQLANCRRFLFFFFFDNRTKPQILSMFLVLRQTADWIICKATKWPAPKHPYIRPTETLGCFRCYPFHRHRTKYARRSVAATMATKSQGHCRAIKFTNKPCTLRPHPTNHSTHPTAQKFISSRPPTNQTTQIANIVQHSRVLRFSPLTYLVASRVEPLSYC